MGKIQAEINEINIKLIAVLEAILLDLGFLFFLSYRIYTVFLAWEAPKTPSGIGEEWFQPVTGLSDLVVQQTMYSYFKHSAGASEKLRVSMCWPDQ